MAVAALSLVYLTLFLRAGVDWPLVQWRSALPLLVMLFSKLDLGGRGPSCEHVLP